VNPDPLAQLRDYHLPEPVGWWPPAPGWWLLALLTLILMGLLLRGLWRWRTRRIARRAALGELKTLEAEYARGGDANALLRGVSRLLRRFALARFPRRQVAGLGGEPWLAFLQRQHPDGGFLDGPGRLLLDAPYRPEPAVRQLPELVQLARRWISRNPGIDP